MFSQHGFQKLFGVLGARFQPPVGSQLWIGAVIEVVCGLAIAAGFQTMWAAFLASGTMAVAYIQFHWKLQFDSGFFPAVNQGESAALYCFVFLFIACHAALAKSAKQNAEAALPASSKNEAADLRPNGEAVS